MFTGDVVEGGVVVAGQDQEGVAVGEEEEEVGRVI